LSKQKTILLTGASGFLGSYLLEALIQQRYNTIVLKRSTSNLWRILHLSGFYSAYDVDIDSVEKAFQENKIDIVIHTACSYGRNGESITDIVNSNLIFGLHLLDACIKYNISHFFNTDTFFNAGNVFQKHLNIYTLSKKQFVDWLKLNAEKINVVNLKLHHLYGPKDDNSKFIPWLISELQRNASEIKLSKGEQKRDFIYIKDAVAAYLLLLNKKISLKGYNEMTVSTGSLVTLKEFIEYLAIQYALLRGQKPVRLGFGELPYREEEIMLPENKNDELSKTGWTPEFSYKQGIDDYLAKIS
jgi:CDP-paratose synthetase